MSSQNCSAGLTSNQMFFLDLLVDMNGCLGLTGNKLLKPLRHEATSPACTAYSPQRDEEQNIQSAFSVFNLASWSESPAGLLQPVNAEADQNSENRVMSWPQAQTAETAAAIKTEVLGHTMKTAHELIMNQIILFAPDADNPFESTHKPLKKHLLYIFQVKLSLWC